MVRRRAPGGRVDHVGPGGSGALALSWAQGPRAFYRTAVQFDLGFLRKINTLVLFAGPWWMQVPVDICGFVPSIYEEYVTTAGITVADAIEKSQEHIVFDIGDRSQMMWWEQKDSETPMRFLAPDDVRCLMTRNLPKPHTTQKGRKEDKRLHWRQTSSGRGRESSMPNITMS